jgi:demethylmenaquinone methyltransferase/2-methoxy-6-polyprenyl-1,4-benzoquinol methylase
MQAYYARRAPEYERIYARPERQADLTQLCTVIERAFAGRSVLDVACGTGYFTAHAARYARSVTGIDANEETLVIACAKNLANAVFAVADAYAIPEPREPFAAALCTFWWSHIPDSAGGLAIIAAFVFSRRSRLEPLLDFCACP